MSSLRPLRGGCQCGRNRYIIAIPQESRTEAQVLFNTDPIHQIPLATPLAAYIRVPLSWYHSTTFAFFPDETHSLIRRVYTHPSQDHSKRNFCGYCGTPLSYWCEDPPSEAAYINLTLGSLLREDLRDLEDMGLIPEEEEEEKTQEESSQSSSSEVVDRTMALRQSFGVPWFDSMVEGTRLGRMRRSQGIQQSQDGRVKVEWEIVEYSGDGAEGGIADTEMESTGLGKRKLQDRDDTDAAA
ncbi:hypothetical protein B0T10DRAFT_56379 [Thelonectria olida]|uniref:CENP-V/GFA domain-containing protein n=1 Tax=Thelonectria olida TaxID=1576542 RepID=A0A9P8W5T8_9HYPO|nr:hypothetical protein B0T10DRAFT_56379 [Thelonectria olida]